MINSQHFVSKKLHRHPNKTTTPKKQTKKCSKLVIFRRFFYTYLVFIVIKMLLDPRVTRTPNLPIWSQTRYHCAIGPHTMTTDFVVYDQKCLFGGSVIINMFLYICYVVIVRSSVVVCGNSERQVWVQFSAGTLLFISIYIALHSKHILFWEK